MAKESDEKKFEWSAVNEDADPTIPRTLAVQGPNHEPIPVETRLFSTPWYGKSALVYVLRRANAGLIYCSVSGFGQEGPMRDFPAIDQIVQSVVVGQTTEETRQGQTDVA